MVQVMYSKMEMLLCRDDAGMALSRCLRRPSMCPPPQAKEMDALVTGTMDDYKLLPPSVP
jgi:hypothetical protein